MGFFKLFDLFDSHSVFCPGYMFLLPPCAAACGLPSHNVRLFEGSIVSYVFTCCRQRSSSLIECDIF